MPKKPAPRKLTQKQSVWTVVFILLLVFIIGFISFSYFRNYRSQPTPAPSLTPQTKTFHSDVMDFTIEVPDKYQVNDLNLAVDLISTNGQISVVRNGTNFTNLDDYISDFDSKRNIKSKNFNKSSFGGYEVLSRIITLSDNDITQKSYYIRVNSMVYIFSTNSVELFSDLDQIAQSFKYTPD